MADIFNDVDDYIENLFVGGDAPLAAALADARASGLPDIQISAGQGKFLYLLAKLVSARRILEIGTLGGYSTIWLARALPADGRLSTLEFDPHHAEVAARSLEGAGLATKVEIVVGSASDTLPKVIDKAAAPFDLVFIDADKESYARYLTEVMRGVRSGTLILADNVVRRGKVLVAASDDTAAAGARAFNGMIAADPRLEAIVVQQVGRKGHDGLAIARVK